MKAQNTDAALIAAFLARGGAVTQVETGANSGFTAREMAQAVRGNRDRLVAPSVQAERDAEKRWHDSFDTAQEARLNGHRVTGYDDTGNIYTDRGRY